MRDNTKPGLWSRVGSVRGGAASGSTSRGAEWGGNGARRNDEEAQLQRAVLDLARVRGWMAYHTYDSRRSVAGFPDLVLVSSRRRRTLVVELKSAKGTITTDQQAWLNELQAAGQVEVAVWRPADWFSGAIDRALT